MSGLVSLYLWAHSACAMPADVFAGAVVGSVLHPNVELPTLVAYACSEHPGGRWSGECSDEGACGPWQVMGRWARALELEVDPHTAVGGGITVAAIVDYTLDRHTRCSGEHDWRAHLKCGPGSRDECSGPVSRWLALEAEVRR